MRTLLGQEPDELHGPVQASLSADLLEVIAGRGTDLFCPPDYGAPLLNAPALLIDPPAGDYVLSARIEADLRATFDAGALILWADDRNWVKLAVELSPTGQPTIVSVVTRTVSDDCNSVALARAEAQLRLARIDDAYALHVQLDGRWSLIRHFSLGDVQARPGFLAQSPTGDGASARFTEIVCEPRRLSDIRDGS
jgi:regulation of enolase protein 1 (concanavalin A-like superfamily)